MLFQPVLSRTEIQACERILRFRQKRIVPRFRQKRTENYFSVLFFRFEPYRHFHAAFSASSAEKDAPEAPRRHFPACRRASALSVSRS